MTISLPKRSLVCQLVVTASLVSACSVRAGEPTQTVFSPPTTTSEPEKTPHEPTPSSYAVPVPSPLSTETPEPVVAVTVTSTLYPPPWMTYIDSTNGFQIDYPDGFAVGTSTRPHLIDDNLLVSFRFPESPPYTSFMYVDDVVVAYIAVRAYGPDEIDRDQVASFDRVIMGGNAFRHFDFSDSAMGGRYGFYDYYFIEHGDLVFRIGFTLYGQGPSAGSYDGMGPHTEETAPPGAQGPFYYVLELMVASLQFLP